MMPDEVKQAIDELNDRLADLFNLYEIFDLALEQFDLEDCNLEIRLKWLLAEMQSCVFLIHDEIRFRANTLTEHLQAFDRPQPGEPLDR